MKRRVDASFFLQFKVIFVHLYHYAIITLLWTKVLKYLQIIKKFHNFNSKRLTINLFIIKLKIVNYSNYFELEGDRLQVFHKLLRGILLNDV